MNTHVKVLGALLVGLSAFGLLAATIVMIGIGGAAGIVGTTADPEDAALAVPIIGMAGSIAVLVMLALSLPGMIAGIGLLKFKSWARILAIVICAIDLLAFPVGTIFGIYGLWVLLNKDTERLFQPGTISPA
jgi:hypothetical protein